jgi:Biotin/lipoate A/B protein ligase family
MLHFGTGASWQLQGCTAPFRCAYERRCKHFKQLRLGAGPRIPFVQYIACLAVVAALDLVLASRFPASFRSQRDFPFRIKWPNDIYVQLGDHSCQKVGGILCQSLATRGTYSIVVGLGLNVDNDEPTVAVNTVMAELAQQYGIDAAAVTRGEVLALVLNEFEALLQVRALPMGVHSCCSINHWCVMTRATDWRASPHCMLGLVSVALAQTDAAKMCRSLRARASLHWTAHTGDTGFMRDSAWT